MRTTSILNISVYLFFKLLIFKSSIVKPIIGDSDYLNNHKNQNKTWKILTLF